MKLGKALKMGEAKSLEIDDSKEYTIAGVQSYGKGVVNRRNELGKNLKMKKYQVIEPDFLMWCKVDTKNGAFGITKEEHKGSLASTNMALAKIDTERFNPQFIERLFTFDFFHGYITHLSSGSTNRKYLTPKQLFELVEIPALNKKEQDEFISLVDRIENLGISTELTHQLEIVKQLRQAFLREAMQGKLVPQDPNDEPASVLLEKIKAEKERLIKENLPAGKAGKIKKQKPLPPITKDEIPFEIEEGQKFIRLGEFFIIEKGKIGIKKAIPGNVPLVVTGEERLTHNEIHFSGAAVIVPLVSSTGHGHASLKRIHFQEGNFAVGNILCCIMPLLPHYFNMKFLFQYLDYYKEFFFVDKMKGAANVSLKISSISETPIPLIDKRIQDKYEEIIKVCDELEASIKESQQQNELLLQQVLREALEPTSDKSSSGRQKEKEAERV